MVDTTKEKENGCYVQGEIKVLMVRRVTGREGYVWEIFSEKVIFELKYNFAIQKSFFGASLVAQWLRICLPMQGTRVRALVWEDPTCRGATGPVSHSY